MSLGRGPPVTSMPDVCGNENRYSFVIDFFDADGGGFQSKALAGQHSDEDRV
jgi:hypothetical protein